MGTKNITGGWKDSMSERPTMEIKEFYETRRKIEGNFKKMVKRIKM